MAKREINVFNISFLDLLSGALGAVLILFIIVPKLTSDIERQLEELEQIKQLKVDVSKIESMMTKLKKSVPKDVYNELSTRIKNLEKTTDDLALEVKTLQNKLAKCDEERQKLRKEVKEQKERITELENRLKNHDSIVNQLKKDIEDQKVKFTKEITELKQQLAESQKLSASLQVKLEDVEPQINRLKAQKEDLEKDIEKIKKEKDAEIAKLKQELEKVKQESLQKDKLLAQFKERVGVEFSDKNIVFVVDQSTSMKDERKMEEVKAGIKMMIATMDDSYRVDIVVFPKSKDERYGYKYGSLKKVTESTKYDLYNYISGLRAYGCTPTKEVMEFVLSSPNYADAGTVTLLSDGLPTLRTSATECDDISQTSEVESFIRSNNAGKVINCIGVGSEFRSRNSTDAKVQFMKKVAQQNGGFYIGF